MLQLFFFSVSYLTLNVIRLMSSTQIVTYQLLAFGKREKKTFTICWRNFPSFCKQATNMHVHHERCHDVISVEVNVAMAALLLLNKETKLELTKRWTDV